MEILVTGANGFVGRSLCQALKENGQGVRAAMRTGSRQGADRALSTDVFSVDAIDGNTDWKRALEGVDAVVHLAARVHVMEDDSSDPLEAFRTVNTRGTANLARMAAAAGVKRFVYVSSIKVNGERTGPGSRDGRPCFTESDMPDPQDAYAVSKWEAEEELWRIAEETGMDMVIVRPPLVYGPAVKANFLRLLKIADRGVPLPLGSVKNRRSLVALENLVDFLRCCIEHPAAAGETFLVSDGEDLSTPELIGRIAQHMGRSARLLPFPPRLLHLCARSLGKGAVTDRLLGSLQVDIGKARHLLGWAPPVSVDKALEKTVAWYMESEKAEHA